LNSTEAIDGLDLFLDEIEAESIGWLPLEPGVYLHVSDSNATEIVIVGADGVGSACCLTGLVGRFDIRLPQLCPSQRNC
jgi:hypothetical protein